MSAREAAARARPREIDGEIALNPGQRIDTRKLLLELLRAQFFERTPHG
ncbi:MAG TPA: hypothetical protein VGM44_16460 [Polyangiaceae bacterium]